MDSPEALRESRAAKAAEADPDRLSRQGKLGDWGMERELSLCLWEGGGGGGGGVGGFSSVAGVINGMRFSVLHKDTTCL